MKLEDNWLNPIDKMKWQEAIRSRQDNVVIDGRTFMLRYEGNSVNFKPTTGFVPMGTMRISDILRDEWLIGEKNTYELLLEKFVDSGLSGVNVSEHWPEAFGTLRAATIKRNFELARTEKTKQVKVLMDDKKVYLINATV